MWVTGWAPSWMSLLICVEGRLFLAFFDTVSFSKIVFEAGHHAVLQQEGHRHGTFIALYAPKSLNTCQCELRKCLIPMKSALSKGATFDGRELSLKISPQIANP